MLAVVQGLQNAGLTVTVMDGRRSCESTVVQGKMTHAKSSVELVNVNGLVRDGKFAGSFMMAHCRTSPSPPAANQTVLPLQKAGPIQSNFKIGSSSFAVKPVPTKLTSFRSAGVSPGRGGPTRPQVSRGTAAFMQTLRKYPSFSITPNRIISTDLVQRLLAYTQAKNFSKSSYHTKTVRPNQAKCTPDSSKNVPTMRANKGCQTYTRARARRRDAEGPRWMDNSGRCPRYRRGRVSPERRSSRYKSRVDDSYDYLQGSPPRNPRSTEVRYLSDVSRCLRQTLRQLCDECDAPTVCPNMQNRYSRHMREHHHTCSRRRQDPNTNDMASQAAIPMDPAEVSSFAPCEAVPGSYLQTCPSHPKLSCFCRTPAPCICRSSSSNAQRSKSRDDFDNKIEEQVYSWLKEIPVHVNDIPENKILREVMARDLINKLKGLDYDENFEENAQNEITEFMKELPMWSPGNKRDQDSLKDMFVDNLVDKIHDINKEDDEFEEEIKLWAEKIPLISVNNQGQPINKGEIIENFIVKLKPLAMHAPSNKNEYKEILNSAITEELGQLPINVETSKAVNSLADDLANKLQDIPIYSFVSKGSIKKAFQNDINDWLTEIPELSTDQSGSENQKQVQELAVKLQSLQSQGINENDIPDRMQATIADWLDNNLKKKKIRFDTNTKSNLSEKLRDKIVETSQAAKNITEQVLDWANHIQGLSSGNKRENQRILESLIEKAHKLQSENKSGQEMENELLDWLGSFLSRKGKNVHPEQQVNLVQNIINSFNHEDPDERDAINQYLSNWLKDIPNINVNASQSKDLIRNLTEKIQELQFQGYNKGNEEDIKNYILDWFNKNPQIQITAKEKDILAQKLLSNVKSMPETRNRWNKNNNIKKQIADGISDIFKDKLLGVSEIMNSKKGRKAQSRITSLVSKNIYQIKADKEKYYKQMIDILVSDTNIPIIKAQQITDNILNKVQYLSEQNHKPPQESEVKEILREEVNNILNKTQIPLERCEEIESNLSTVMADHVIRGENIERTKERLMSILLNSNMSEEESEKVANSLLGKGKEMSLSYQTQDSFSRSSGQFAFKAQLNPKDFFFLENKALEEILEFTVEVTGDSSILSQKKWKPAAKQLAQKFGNIIGDPNKTIEDTKQRLDQEVLEYFQDLGLDIPSDMDTQNLTDKLQKLVPQTSTPRRSKDQISFHPQKDGLAISPIADRMFPFNYQQITKKEEEKYMSQLINKIDSWMQALPIDLNTKEGKNFKDVMIRDLVGDILDRQKYLQLNPIVKTSDEEELEHLKYQVFRWLNKLPDVKQLIQSISKTDELMNLIKGVPVPRLTKPFDINQDGGSARDSYIEESSNTIQDEIYSWLESIPSHLYTSSNQNHHKLMVKELAQNVAKLQANASLSEETFQNLIDEWLHEMLNSSRESVYKMSQGLRSELIDKGVIKLSPERKSSKAIQSELQTFILDWIKDKELYQRRMSVEKRQIEQIVSTLSQNIKNALTDANSLPDDQKDNYFVQQIQSQFEQMPIDLHLKSDEKFIYSTAVELLECIKKLPYFRDALRDISGESQIYSCSPREIVDHWMKSLPLNPRRTSKENRQFEKLKQEFKQVLENLKQKSSFRDIPDERIGEEIKNYLQSFPIDPIKKADPFFIRNKVSELLQQLQNAQSNKGVSNPYDDLNSNKLKSIQNEICDWFGGINPDLYSSRDERYHRNMINELAGNILKHQESNMLTNTTFYNLLTKWLQKMLCESKVPFDSLCDGLQAILLYKGLIKLGDHYDYTRPKRSIIAEELESHVLDWLKDKEIYKRSTSNDKREQEKIVSNLSKQLKDLLKSSIPIKSDDRDKILLQEIKKHIKTLPMAVQQKYDDNFHNITANELLEYLTSLDIFQDSSSQPLPTSIDFLPAVLDKWMESLPVMPGNTSIERQQLDNLQLGLQKKLEQLMQKNPVFTEAINANIKEEIKNYLQAIPIDPSKKHNHQFVQEKIGQLQQKLKELQTSLKSRIPSINSEILKKNIKNKLNKLHFLPGKTVNDVENELNKFVPKLKDTFNNINTNNINIKQIQGPLEKEINSFLDRLPLDKTKLRNSDIKGITDNVYGIFKEARAQVISPNLESTLASKTVTKKAADILYENVEEWCENLPILDGETPEEKVKVKTLKQNLASKLINKIGDLNMHPELFNDDSLYSEFLSDELDNIFSSLPTNQELETSLPALKDNLIEKVKEAKQKTQDELAGYVYKQKLHNAISKTLPSSQNLSEEEQAPFEVLKDELADAYINLHHAANTDKIKNDLQEKLTFRINSFCNNYLKHFPGTPLDPKTLNQELHKVLQKVHDPKDEIIKDQVEQIRIKNEINDWLKNLPLKGNLTPSEQLQKNKIVSVLAKRLHDIENEKENIPDLDVKDKMQKEIQKWIHKLPINPGEEASIDKMAKQLTEKLINTEHTRKFNISNIQQSQGMDEQKNKIRICPDSLLGINGRYPSPCISSLPPCTLSPDERAYLEIIRERANRAPCQYSIPTCCCKDASVSPKPQDNESQTEIGQTCWEVCGSTNKMHPQMSVASDGQFIQTDHGFLPGIPQQPLSPQVIIREHYWDSTNGSKLLDSGYIGLDGTSQPPHQSQYMSPQRQGMYLGQQYQKDLLSQAPSYVAPQQIPIITPNLGTKPQISGKAYYPPCAVPSYSHMTARPPFMMKSPCTRPQQSSPSPSPRIPSQSHCSPPTTCMQRPSPCMPSRPSCMRPSKPCMLPTSTCPSRPPCMPPPSPCMPPLSPCIPPRLPCKPTCITPQSPYMTPRPPFMGASSQVTTRQSSTTSRRHNKRPCSPCYKSPVISDTSSPIETDFGPSRSFRIDEPRVIRLGSLDDVHPQTRTCGSQSPQQKRSCGSPVEEFEWTIRFPEDTDFWGSANPRRCVHKIPRNARPFLKEKERKEEKVRCRYQSPDDSIRRCSKCCGSYCPHPSYLYF